MVDCSVEKIKDRLLVHGYRLECKLGSGTFGGVFKAVSKTGAVVAMKVCLINGDKDEDSKGNVRGVDTLQISGSHVWIEGEHIL